MFALLFLVYSKLVLALCAKRTTHHNTACIHVTKILLLISLAVIFCGLIKILIIMSGDVHVNPGPKLNKFKFATWNADSLLSREKCKLDYISALDSVHKFDIFGVCETFLGPKTDLNHLVIPGYHKVPYRADCLEEGRPKGGVCLYYKNHVPIKNREDLVTLYETIVSEIRLKNNKKVFVVLAYRSPSKSTVLEIDNFCENLTRMLDKMKEENPQSIIITGDFNGRSPFFWEHETTENTAGKRLVEFSTLNCLTQLINEPTHFPKDNIKTCIDHIYTSKPEGFTDFGVIHSPDPKCKHSIIHGSLNFSLPPPPPYSRKVWKYGMADLDEIRLRMNTINWYHEFYIRSVNDCAEYLTSTLLEIFQACIPNKEVVVNENDAPWINDDIKSLIKRKQQLFRRWRKNNSDTTKENLSNAQITLQQKIDDAKSRYTENLINKLNDPNSSHKTFWSAYNKFLNKKKITNIPPIENDNSYVTCFREKAELFNSFFSKQCTPLNDNNYLPPVPYKTRMKLLDFRIDQQKVVTIINSLNPTKASGPDNISVRMLQLCPNEMSFILKLFFEKILQSGEFPSMWKQANVQPVHKKGSRQLIKNYRPISLLPVCSKILEKLIFDQLYLFLMQNNLISEKQSGFKPGDSTIYQLISITNEIYESFEDYCETRALFLDLSKAFDKVWHLGLKKKLIVNGIDGNAFKILDSFLSDREQRVVMNGCASGWQKIKSGVPQGSVLGPLLFLIYINDLTENISSNIRLFADDVALFIKVVDPNVAFKAIESDLATISKWAETWKMQFNPDPTKPATEVVFSYKKNKLPHPQIKFNNVAVKTEESTVHLGVILDSKLNFSDHVSEKIKKANQGISLLKFLSSYTNRGTLNMLYKMHVRCHLEYGDMIYHDQLCSTSKLLESIQYNAGLIITGCWKGTNKLKLYTELGWESLSNRRHCRRLCLFYKILNNLSPPYLKIYPPRRINSTQRYQNSFFPYCITHWKNLPVNVKRSAS